MAGRSSLLVACKIAADQEEPWRRLLQELSDRGRKERYVQSRRRLGISAESVWLVPKSSGGGLAVVYLEALDPERVLGELAASEAPFDLGYSGGARKLVGFEYTLDFSRVPQSAVGELLFAWREDVPDQRGATKNP